MPKAGERLTKLSGSDLSQPPSTDVFPGSCMCCGKAGHKGVDCPPEIYNNAFTGGVKRASMRYMFEKKHFKKNGEKA